MKHRKYVLPILIATALATPTAFAQVLGGGINVGGGLGAQAGSIGVAAGMQAHGDAGVGTDAVRTTARRLRGAAARADAEARAAVAAGLSAASQVPMDASMAAATGGQPSSDAAVDLQAAAQGGGAVSASGSVEGSVAGSAHATDPASAASGQAMAAVSGSATAAANSALTAQAGSQGGDPAARTDKTTAGKAERKRGRHTP